MERYLVYDAKCTTCNRLAQRIEEAVAGRLEAIDIQSEKAKGLLHQAYPGGWEHNPYLVAVEHGHVRARTGFGAALRLGLLMGPRKALRVWSLAHRSGIPLPPGSRAATAYNQSRRQFLKVSGALAATAAGAGWLSWRSLSPALAQSCGPCTAGCYDIGSRCGIFCYPTPECEDLCTSYVECYDSCNNPCAGECSSPYDIECCGCPL